MQRLADGDGEELVVDVEGHDGQGVLRGGAEAGDAVVL